MPRSARSSFTSRYERPNRRYHRTARVMTSGGKRYPAKAELGAGRTGRCRRDLIARVSLMRTPAANATVPGCAVHDEHEDVERPEPDRLHAEKVARDNALGLRP